MSGHQVCRGGVVVMRLSWASGSGWAAERIALPPERDGHCVEEQHSHDHQPRRGHLHGKRQSGGGSTQHPDRSPDSPPAGRHVNRSALGQRRLIAGQPSHPPRIGVQLCLDPPQVLLVSVEL